MVDSVSYTIPSLIQRALKALVRLVVSPRRCKAYSLSVDVASLLGFFAVDLYGT